MGKAKIWEETIVIPTYKVFPPEKSPLFIEKRAYQGSTGKVYPLPVTEKISDTKEDESYKAVFLENEYLKVMVLPELGGRIQRAYDKTNGYDFVYYNEVVKPALVGLAGPWISGGIEFNWPQHHRPSTYSPVDYCIKEMEDGTVTVFLSEIDKMYGTKGEAAISLMPGKAYIEIRGQLFNNTEMPQTFLWWANPAVAVNDSTYSVFPPDVNAVMDHGKRAVSTFPIATGEYYKQDYSAGVDISRYKNIKVPTSYMAAHSDFDFIGNYDESKEAGLLHIADHHISPGKKQWTWGNGDFGRTWDRNLTDENGPYIELMTGVFCDNQPDFTWLKPHEEKNFVQYFMPYKGVGRVSNATKECAVSLTPNGKNQAELKVYATSVYEGANIIIKNKDDVIYENIANLTPKECFSDLIKFKSNLEDITVSVRFSGRELVSYRSYVAKPQEIPSPAKPMEAPVDIKSNEDLWLCGMHLEQYRHATREPADYYEEGLRRDPKDIRINNSYGLLLFRRGNIKESIKYFETAIEHQTMKNTNPYYGECYMNLGLALMMSGEVEKAYDAFYKASWSAETQANAFYWLAALSSQKGDLNQALSFIDQSIYKNFHDVKARNLKLTLMRRLGIDNTAYLKECLDIDPLYMGFVYENYLKLEGVDIDETLIKLMGKDAHNYLELSLNYMNGGFYEDALKILSYYEGENPMAGYYMAYVYSKLGGMDSAKECAGAAEQFSEDFVFPNRIEEIAILENSIKLLDKAPKAHLYLGNLFYDKKQYYRAHKHWLKATEEDGLLAMAYRNLAIYYYNKCDDKDAALKAMEKAVKLDNTYPRYYLELDQLYARCNKPLKSRLELMEKNLGIINKRDDLYLRYITLLNCCSRFEDALNCLMGHTFHPWEGGEGKASTQYKYSLINLAKEQIEEKEYKKAIILLDKTLSYPENLGEGKLPNVNDNEAYYYLGVAYSELKDTVNAKRYFELAASGDMEPSGVLYYNDQPSDYIYFIGMAKRALCDENGALKAFHQLQAFGERHMFDKVEYDFFAVSLPEIEIFQENIQLRNDNYCDYLRLLAARGLENTALENEMEHSILNRQCDYQIH